MKIIRPFSNRARKVFQKQMKMNVHLPKTHIYDGLTIKELVAECAKRKQTGRLQSYGTSWRLPRLVAELLRNDGEKVTINWTLPNGKIIPGGKMVPGTEEEVMDVDNESLCDYGDDSESELEWTDETWQARVRSEPSERTVSTRAHTRILAAQNKDDSSIKIRRHTKRMSSLRGLEIT